MRMKPVKAEVKSADLQHSEGTGLVLVGAQQSQGAPQLHQTSENKELIIRFISINHL